MDSGFYPYFAARQYSRLDWLHALLVKSCDGALHDVAPEWFFAQRVRGRKSQACPICQSGLPSLLQTMPATLMESF
jgi:hypothetical protein